MPEIRDREGALTDFQVRKQIRFENITFKYPTAPENAKNVLEGVTFHIRAGETTAIVGPSGSGKSTIVQMIERFYTPNVGDIYFDDTDIKDITLKALRESIGYVSQEPVLILGTIKDNMLFGNKDATEAEIKEALKKANAEFVYETTEGLDAYIGSSSVLNMSGGQKQRIAIARALLKRPKILIMDEATSALDPKSEREVQDAIDSIAAAPSADSKSARLTIVMIAHRLQTIMTAQNLLYIDSKNCLLAGAKGTPEYDTIMHKLQEENYKHQNEDKQAADDGPVGLVEPGARKASVAGLVRQGTDRETGAAAVESEAPEEKKVSMGRIMSHYNPKWLAVLGIIVSVLNATAFPLYGFIFSKILFVMMTHQLPTFHHDRDFWCGMFLLLCFCIGLLSFLQKYLFMYVGENLTFDIRNQLYQGIIYKQLSWFDSKDRAPGILSNVLSEDINCLNGMTTEHLSVLIEAFLGLFIGIAIAMAFTWKMGLITLGMVPMVALGGIMMSRLQWKTKPGQTAERSAADDPYKKSNALLSDIIMNYRTVIGFGSKNVDYLLGNFDALLDAPNRMGIKNAHLSGFYFGYSQCVRFVFIGIVFLIAAEFIYHFDEDSQNTYIGVYTLFVAALGSGLSMSSAPSVSKAQSAASTIFSIIDEPSKIDTRSNEGVKVVTRGEIEFRDASFQYPSRN